MRGKMFKERRNVSTQFLKIKLTQYPQVLNRLKMIIPLYVHYTDDEYFGLK